MVDDEPTIKPVETEIAPDLVSTAPEPVIAPKPKKPKRQPTTRNVKPHSKIVIENEGSASFSVTPIKYPQRTKVRKAADYMREYWRPATAALYLFLCFLDYAVRPTINYIFYRKVVNFTEITQIVKSFPDPAVQIKALEIAATHEPIPPILTEIFHLSFGAILTGAAVTRGMEKINQAKYNTYNGNGYESRYTSGADTQEVDRPEMTPPAEEGP